MFGTLIFGAVLIGAANVSSAPKTWEIVLKNNRGTLYGVIEKEEGNVIVLRIDDPERNDMRTLRRDEIETRRQELSSERENRWKRTHTLTPIGWQPNAEYQLAKRAKAMAAELEARRVAAESPPPESEAASPAKAGPPPKTGPLAYRGPQILLSLGGLVLIAIIVKLVILGGQE